MHTIVLDRSGSHISTRGDSLVVRTSEHSTACYPARLVERLVLLGTHTIDTSAISLLTGFGASIQLLSGKSGSHLASVHGSLHNDASLRINQHACMSDPIFRHLASARLLLFKLRSQYTTLRRILHDRPDLNHSLHMPLSQVLLAISRINTYLRHAQPSDLPSIATLRGIEGATARVYFLGYKTAFAPSLGFQSRNRRPPRDPVNAVLSLCYTLLNHEAAVAAQTAGLDAALGFFHAPAFGRPALACDLIEPLRAVADLWTYALLHSRTLRSEHFSMTLNGCFLRKAGRAHFYREYAGLALRARKHLRRHAALLARHIRQYARSMEIPASPEFVIEEAGEVNGPGDNAELPVELVE